MGSGGNTQAVRPTALIVAALLAVLVVLSMAGDAASAKTGACSITGTNGADVLRGTDGDDVICGRGGNDRIRSRGGRDVIRAGSGADIVLAAAGSDRLMGGSGNDRLLGEAKSDRLLGGPGRDRLIGGPGKDNCDFSDPLDVAIDCQAAYWARDLEVTPASIDTSESDRFVHVSLDLVNALLRDGSLVGVSVTTMSDATGPSESPFSLFFANDRRVSSLTRVAGTADDGTWSGDLLVPRHSAQGRHELCFVFSTAQPGLSPTYRSYCADDLPGTKSAESFQQTGLGDTGAPRIESLTLSKHTVDTSAQDVEITATVHATDDLEGVKRVQVDLDPPQDGRSHPNASIYSLQQTSGTALDGTWEGTLTLPRYTAKGLHRATVYASDGFYWETADAAALQSAGSDPYVQQAGEDDHTSPSLTSLDFQPQNGGVLVRIGIADAQSGPVTVEFSGYNPGWGYWQPGLTVSGPPVSGDRHNGVWEVWEPGGSGRTDLDFVRIGDAFYNDTIYRAGDLTAAGFPSGFTLP